MGRRGPKPEPKALKLFKGTRFKRPDSVEPPQSAIPTPPEWLGLHGRAKWVEVGPHLAAVGLFASIDGGALAQYCAAWDEFHDADQLVRENGMTYTSDKGNHLANPAVSIRQKARQAIRQWGGEFGLSPAARVSLPGTGGGAVDEMEEFKVG
jgi:P27 family predicted phage terminase small subunit